MNNKIVLSEKILNSLENPEIIPFNKSDYKGYMVFSKEKNNKLDEKKYGNRYAHRYYACYDLSKNDEKENIITFILFNPSTANPKNPIDQTIKNCLSIAEKKNYNYVEIINVFSYRSSTVTNECLKNNQINYDFMEYFITNYYENRVFVKAWGFGKKSAYIKDVEEFLKGKTVMKLGVSKHAIEKLEHKILHPAKSTWSVFGGFDKSAELVPCLTSEIDIDKK